MIYSLLADIYDVPLLRNMPHLGKELVMYSKCSVLWELTNTKVERLRSAMLTLFDQRLVIRQQIVSST